MAKTELPKGYKTWLEVLDTFKEKYPYVDIDVEEAMYGIENEFGHTSIHGIEILSNVALELLEHRPTAHELHAIQTKLSWTLSVSKEIHNTIQKLYKIAKK